MLRRILFMLLVLAFVPALGSAEAQTTADRARLYVTVLDPANAAVPAATVTLVGTDDATRKATIAPITSSDKGLATFENVVPGRYAIQATMTGFNQGLLRDVTLRRGDNRHAVVLTLKAVAASVEADGGGQEAASSRSTTAFGLNLSRETIDTLSDDPAELQRQLLELAGPDAVIRVDSFEGSQLPPRSLIKSVHVTRDQFAAEADLPGSTFVDIITQAGSGPLTGQLNLMSRANRLAGASPFVSVRQPEAYQNYSGMIGGTLKPNVSDFSLNIRASHQSIQPILNQAGSPARVLNVKQPNDAVEGFLVLNYALTKDQTLRTGFAMARQQQSNLGIGQYDGPERAFDTRWWGYQFRALEAGPLGRRTFQNTRLQVTHIENKQTSALEQPTIVIQDLRTTGGAQVGGGVRQTNFILVSDVDYIRGIHSWRAGFQGRGGWFDADSNAGYLGTYTFADEASYLAGKPLLYTQTIGNPRVSYFNMETSLYLQDDVRVSRALTFSPGVRYFFQTHVKDWSGVAPRFGTTWSPFKSGRTSVRASAGIFYWPMEMQRVYERTLRLDGQHQQQVIVVNPSYPDPGTVTGLPPNKYLLGDWSLQRNLRYSLGVDQTITPRLRANVLYAYWHQFDYWRGKNVNAPVGGVRPDPAFANIIEAVTDGQIRRHDLTVNVNLSMLAPSPAANAARFNWKRVSVAATYGTIRAWQSGDNDPFTPPPTGTLDTEWARGQNDQKYRATVSLTSTQLRNLNVNLAWNAQAGVLYTQTTGIDGNGDGILNDRPDGVTLRTLRGADQSTLNLRASYTIMTNAATAPVPGIPGPRRYRVAFNMNATNLTNRANYGGYSGNMQSPNFQTPTLVVNPRRVELGMTVGF